MTINPRSFRVGFYDTDGKYGVLMVSGWAGEGPNQQPLTMGVYRLDPKRTHHYTIERNATEEECRAVLTQISQLIDTVFPSEKE